MVRTVNLLASDDSASAGRVGPTVTAGIVRALVGALDRLGFQPSALLAAANLQPRDLEDPDARFPLRTYLAVLARVRSERPSLRNLALHVAAATPMGAYPLTDYLVVTSDTLGEGFEQLARYVSTAGAPLSLELDTAGDPVRVIIRSPFHQFGAEYTVALHYFHSRREISGPFTATEVAFQHQLEDVTEWQQTLGCPVATGSSWTGIALPRSVWQLPFKRRDPSLRAFLERQAADIASRMPSADRDDLASAVRRVLLLRVAGGDTGIERVARQLGTTPRTLQRRLAAAGLAYHKLLDEMRSLAAQHHLAESVLSIGEIAFLLGYADRATFHRAFRRWTGITPQAYRKRSAPPEVMVKSDS